MLTVVALLCVTCAMSVFAVSAKGGNEKNLGYPPDVTIYYQNYSENNVPSAIKNVPYKIFSAYAEDVYGNELDVTTKVYIHYLEPSKSLVTIDDKGYAMPKYCGTYTVEYSARDKFGNVGSATYDFVCEDNADYEGLSLNLYGDFDENVKVGAVVKIKNCSYSGNIGNAVVTVTAVNEEKGITVDLTGKTSFIPFYTGSYVIVYECKDYNFTVTESYELSVGESDKSLIYSEPALPKYFIVGKEYVLPDAECYSFADGSPVGVNPTVSVKYDNGNEQEIGNTFTATTEGNITFKYSVSGDYKEYVCKAVNVGTDGGLDLSKYFYSDTAVASIHSDSITYEAKTNGEQIEFINAAESHNFDFMFSIPEGYDNFFKLNLFLVSKADASKILKISYSKSGETSIVTVNDESSFECEESFSSARSVTVGYSDESRIVRFGSLTIELEDFSGFDNEKVYFSFSLEGIEGKSGINVVKIANQIFSEITSDQVEPIVYFETYSGGVEEIGSTVTVNRIFVFDVLDPDYNVSYSIKTPSGVYVVDVNGVTLDATNANYEQDYSFIVSEYGRYTVTIYVKDSSSNEEIYAYSITVADVESPTVELKSELKNNLKVGESFVVSELNVTDDKSESFEIFAYVIKPSMMTEEVEVGKTYQFNKKGQYVLCYVVRDETGNSTVLTHTFAVE